MGTGSSLG